MFRITFLCALMASVFVLTGFEPAAAQERGESMSAESRDDGGRGNDGGEDDGDMLHLVNIGGNRGESSAVIHDSDEQLDVWVQRCNDAGGGMSTGGDGNYTCSDSNGNEIEDY